MIKYFNIDLISISVLIYIHVCWYIFTYNYVCQYKITFFPLVFLWHISFKSNRNQLYPGKTNYHLLSLHNLKK